MKAEALTPVQSACYPFAEYLAVRHNRAHGIALGAFLWATATFLVAFSSTFTEVAMSRALNGIGLALVTPAIQSLVADSTDDNNREIVPERSRTNVYALDRSSESILSSFAPPGVGILAHRVYGYKPVPQGSSAAEEIATDRGNALSLAKAPYTAIGIPMALCCVIYSFLYCTYPRDRERARMEGFTSKYHTCT
ncbi:hypothetical protein C1H46_025604 [Malus baccata]|uniref:Major facilitator superfamily (MFS) profile domain-containing protein n=1 Tax=Malus baccata TaxID=106549 RepID=A0A540LQQ1_MALBA|nr:hypothetical protein C1H46_025604 [Malus baccata]